MPLRCPECGTRYQGRPEPFPKGYTDPDRIHICPTCGSVNHAQVLNDITVLTVADEDPALQAAGKVYKALRDKPLVLDALLNLLVQQGHTLLEGQEG